jgi:multiple sugar transport system permease protein
MRSSAQVSTEPAKDYLRPGLERWMERHLRVLMLAPAMAILAGLTLFPTIYMFAAAFQQISPDPTVPREFVGFGNFARIFREEEALISFKNTIVFTVSAVSIEFVLGLGLALLFERYVRRFAFLKTILMMPMMLPSITVAITWKLIYQPQFGVLNELMYRLGLPAQAWAGDYNLAMLSIIVVDVWQWTPFMFLLMLAGLASLPDEPYEAASIDGASSWRQFWDLTLPFLKPVIAIAVLLRMMDALRLFDIVFVLTAGGPANATVTTSYYIYKYGRRFLEIGYAAAISLVVLAVTIAISTWFIRRMRIAD